MLNQQLLTYWHTKRHRCRTHHLGIPVNDISGLTVSHAHLDVAATLLA